MEKQFSDGWYASEEHGPDAKSPMNKIRSIIIYLGCYHPKNEEVKKILPLFEELREEYRTRVIFSYKLSGCVKEKQLYFEILHHLWRPEIYKLLRTAYHPPEIEKK